VTSSHIAENAGNQKSEDERFMRRAFALAQETAALASPNPQVGCVLVRDGAIIAEGAHRYAARDHAEIVALKQAGEAARGATAYVTLEPCAHHGRTGPCADALIARGIRRVVVATEDPNPLVSGEGLARLRAAGIEVTTGILAQPARELNDAFAHFIQHCTPFVTLKAALSADGYLAPPPAARASAQPHWLTGPESRAEVQRLRHASDAVLTGIGTVLADDPALTDRTGLPRRRPLVRVVLDAQLRTPPGSQLIATAMHDVLIFTSASASAENMHRLRKAGAEVEIIEAQDGRLNLQEVLKALAARDILSVLLEAGTHLNAAFLREDLIGKVVLFRAPAELGPGSVPFAEDITPESIEQRLTRAARTHCGPDTCTTGYLHNPWP